MGKRSFSIQVSGRVQGVFFRASTKEKADALGLKGIVRNEQDGSVYIEAEGEEEKINEFLEWCKTGPQLARVQQCLQKEIDMRGYTSFDIKR